MFVVFADEGEPEIREARLMPTASLDPSHIVPASVLKWRSQQLEAAGYSPHDAYRLAERTDIDLHVAADLLRDGCPPEVALRILD